MQTPPARIVIRALAQAKIVHRLVGVIILAAALWFLWVSFSQNFGAVAPLLSDEPQLWLGAAALAPVYGLSLFLLAFAWVSFLPANKRGPQTRPLFYAYVATSIGKYFPGGVFHFGGRQAFGARLGLSQGQLLKATIGETAAAAGAALSLGGALFITGVFDPVIVIVMALIVGVAISIGARSASRFIKPALAAAVFMAVMGAIAAVSAAMLQLGAPPMRIAGAYLIAWCAGFLAPGVSAGIGVREAVLIYLLGDDVAVGEAAALAIVMRFVTMAGDALFFLSAPLFRFETAKTSGEGRFNHSHGN